MSKALQTETWAVTERGRRIKHSEDEVKAALTALVLNGGVARPAITQLKDEGIKVSVDQLTYWRDTAFAHLYWQLRKDLGRHVGEDLAGRALETARRADEATQTYLEAAVAKVDRVPAEHLAKNAAALANTMSINVEKAQTLRHEPNEIVETRDVGSMIKELEALKVLKRQPYIEGESEEE